VETVPDCGAGERDKVSHLSWRRERRDNYMLSCRIKLAIWLCL
jgi:hypothetical protein